MGEVWRARDSRLGRDVAIKVLPAAFTADPDRLRRFEQEARAAGLLNHPNILAIYDIGTTTAGAPYLVSELLDGQTLRQRLGDGALPVRKAIDHGLDIARGLTAAHAKGVVHRDLKPENLFLTRDGRVKILDFGLAKLMEPEFATLSGVVVSTLTEPGVVIGTVAYMSPEQVRGQPIDHRSDLFSFGTVLYEMLSGRRAFQRETGPETMTAILTDEPSELASANPNISPALEQIVRHCLDKDSAERFQSARDVVFALETLSAAAPTSGAALLPQQRQQSKRLRTALAGLAIVGAIAASFLAGVRTAKTGSPSLPTFTSLTSRRGYVPDARFAPDGQTIVYGAAWDGRPLDVFSTRADSAEARSLGLSAASVLAISSKGELAISQDCEFAVKGCHGTLARVPLAGGVARPIAENVRHADWSPDGTQLAAIIEDRRRWTFRLEYPIGHVLYSWSPHDFDGWLGPLRVSPSGDRIAFFDDSDLAVIDLAGHKTRLSSGYALRHGSIAWSPKGDEVWFGAFSRRDGFALHAVTLAGHDRVIWRSPAPFSLNDLSQDGRALVTLVDVRHVAAGLPPGAATERDLSWFVLMDLADLSSDGTRLLFNASLKFVSPGIGAHEGLYLRRTDGTPPVRLGDGDALALSPDGRWALASVADGAAQTLVLMPIGPGQPRTLPRGPIQAYDRANWLPDGRRLVFSALESGRQPRFYVQDVDGGLPTPITPEDVWTADLSRVLSTPDGRFVTGEGPDRQVMLYPVQGGQPPQPIKGLALGDEPLQWSADQRFLYVRGRDQMPARVYRLEVATGRRQLWKEFVPADPAGVFGVQRPYWTVLITPDGKTYVYSYDRWLNELQLVEGFK
jgi:serine/threonine protein kinase/WD40 repeat protein